LPEGAPRKAATCLILPVPAFMQRPVAPPRAVRGSTEVGAKAAAPAATGKRRRGSNTRQTLKSAFGCEESPILVIISSPETYAMQYIVVGSTEPKIRLEAAGRPKPPRGMGHKLVTFTIRARRRTIPAQKHNLPTRPAALKNHGTPCPPAPFFVSATVSQRLPERAAVQPSSQILPRTVGLPHRGRRGRRPVARHPLYINDTPRTKVRPRDTYRRRTRRSQNGGTPLLCF